MKDLFKSFEAIKVAVVGDVMLDTYWWGHVERISPEAPVPIVALEKKEYRIGGAGNVALNLSSLKAQVHVLSVIGKDEDGVLLEKMMQEKGIHTSLLYKSKQRITTNKIRVISRNQQMMRLDSELSKDLDAADEANFIREAIAQLQKIKPDILIFEDYNKGVLTEKTIEDLIGFCKTNNILTAVDPKRKNFFCYKGVDIFKPNLKEAREALNIIDNTVNESSLELMHRLLHEKLAHQISFITLSEHGVFYQQGNDANILAAYIRNIADVSGAGDTVIAVASLVYAATKDKKLMAEISNLAGGLVCEEVGTVAIDAGKLIKECEEIGLDT